jgi:hypothetical protein
MKSEKKRIGREKGTTGEKKKDGIKYAWMGVFFFDCFFYKRMSRKNKQTKTKKGRSILFVLIIIF